MSKSLSPSYNEQEGRRKLENETLKVFCSSSVNFNQWHIELYDARLFVKEMRIMAHSFILEPTTLNVSYFISLYSSHKKLDAEK
jgi:hypothetical protein